MVGCSHCRGNSIQHPAKPSPAGQKQVLGQAVKHFREVARGGKWVTRRKQIADWDKNYGEDMGDQALKFLCYCRVNADPEPRRGPITSIIIIQNREQHSTHKAV